MQAASGGGEGAHGISHVRQEGAGAGGPETEWRDRLRGRDTSCPKRRKGIAILSYPIGDISSVEDKDKRDIKYGSFVTP